MILLYFDHKTTSKFEMSSRVGCNQPAPSPDSHPLPGATPGGSHRKTDCGAAAVHHGLPDWSVVNAEHKNLLRVYRISLTHVE